MIHLCSPLILAAALAMAINPLAAQNESATAVVTYEVREINEIKVSGNPGALVVRQASGSNGPADAIDALTTWSVTTNQTRRKVTAALDSNLPRGLSLRITLMPPEGGVSAPAGLLSTVPQDLVTGFGSVHSSELGITYTLSATPEAGVVTRASRTVTFTIVADV